MKKLPILMVLMAVAAAARGEAPGVAEMGIPVDVMQKVDASVVAIQHERAVGSGFILSPDGYILTNGHVAKGDDEEDPTRPAQTITVILNNERKFSAKVLGFSMDPDVALLKIDPDAPLQPVEIADSRSARIGQRCFAVGTPVGLKRTFTAGILSNVTRADLDTETPVLQTDAAINPGNSGGPLFDREGRVLGINTYASQGQNNLGFTIPIHVALVLKDHFMKSGRFVRGIVPVFMTSELYAELAATLGVEKGVLVPFVLAGSKADLAGLRAGDVIVATDGQPTAARTRAEMMEYEWGLTTRKPGTEVVFTVSRGEPGKRTQREIRAPVEETEPLPKMGRHEGELVEYRYDALGLGVRRLVTYHRLIYGLSEAAGVLATTVDRAKSAGRAGLQMTDVITAVDDRPTPTVEDFTRELEAGLSKHAKYIGLTVSRRQMTVRTAIEPYYGLKEKRALLVIPPGDLEFADLIRRELLAEGACLSLAAREPRDIAAGGRTLRVSGKVSDIKGKDFDLIVFAGGAGSHVWMDNADTLRLVRAADESKAVLAAVGPAAVAVAGGVPGLADKKMTTSKDDSTEAVKRKLKYTGADVEKDGRLVTTTGMDRDTIRKFVGSLKQVVRGNGHQESPAASTDRPKAK
jgi:serine protease Do